MKILNSKLVKNTGKRKGKRKYLLALEMTDYDMEMLENIVMCEIDDIEDEEYYKIKIVCSKWFEKFFKRFKINTWKKFK